MNTNKITEMRIKKLLLSDKIKAYDGFVEMLKSDIQQVARTYMKVGAISIDIETQENNSYLLKIEIEAKDIISPASTI